MTSTPPPETRLTKEWLDNNTVFISELDDLLTEVSKFNAKTYWPHGPVEDLIDHPNQVVHLVHQFLNPETNDWKSTRHEEEFDWRAESRFTQLENLKEFQEKKKEANESMCVSCENWKSASAQVANICSDCWQTPYEDVDKTEESNIQAFNYARLDAASKGLPTSVEVDNITYVPGPYKARMAVLK